MKFKLSLNKYLELLVPWQPVVEVSIEKVFKIFTPKFLPQIFKTSGNFLKQAQTSVFHGSDGDGEIEIET